MNGKKESGDALCTSEEKEQAWLESENKRILAEIQNILRSTQ